MDAQLNRARILEVAKEAFARSGAGTSLDEIVNQAVSDRESSHYAGISVASLSLIPLPHWHNQV